MKAAGVLGGKNAGPLGKRGRGNDKGVSPSASVIR